MDAPLAPYFLVQLSYDLTPRESEVLQLILAGETSKAICHALNVSDRTVSTHKINILRKTRCNTIVDLVKLGLREGLIDLGPAA